MLRRAELQRKHAAEQGCRLLEAMIQSDVKWGLVSFRAIVCFLVLTVYYFVGSTACIAGGLV